jgi:polyisoprenoid-binding protein YceI
MHEFSLAAAATLLTLMLVGSEAAARNSSANATNNTGAAMAATSPQTSWTIDKTHSRIGFSVAHFVITQVTGYFRDFDARVTCACPADDFTGGTVDFTAKTASIFTDNKQRDGHLRSDAFFNAKKYPDMKFMGTLVKQDGKNILKGNLTIRDITKPVSFDVAYGGRIKDKNFGIEKAGFKITGKVNRLEFGLKWNETFEGGSSIVGEEVALDVNVEIDKKNLVDAQPSPWLWIMRGVIRSPSSGFSLTAKAKREVGHSGSADRYSETRAESFIFARPLCTPSPAFNSHQESILNCQGRIHETAKELQVVPRAVDVGR